MRTPLFDKSLRVTSDRVLVQFRRGVRRSTIRGLAAARGAVLGQRIQGLGLAPIDVMRVPAGMPVSSLVGSLRSDPAVKYASPNTIRYVSQPTPPNDPSYAQLWGHNNTDQTHGASAPPSGATAAGTSGADANVLEAWVTQTGDDTPSTPATAPVIAILDSGTDVTHPDLAPNLWVNPGDPTADGVDDDGNHLIDDVHGWNFAQNNDELFDNDPSLFGYDHGTHVAGIAAAAANNSVGVAGVCPDCRIMVIKLGTPVDADPNTPGNDTMGIDLVAELSGAIYAAEMGADVINMSFGAALIFDKFERRVLKAVGEAGVTLVAAAGNSNGDNDMVLTLDFGEDASGSIDSESPDYPAAYNLPTMITVAASNHHDELAYFTTCEQQLQQKEWPCTFTNWGHDSVEVAAPGVDILSTLPGNTYDYFDGTSMAAPFVAGVAGLVKAQNPSYTPQQVRAAIMNTADGDGFPAGAPLDQLFAYPGFPASGDFVRTGRVDAQLALTGSTAILPKTDGNVDGAVSISTSKSGSVAWPEDVNDVFKKKLTKGNRYKVILDGPSGQDFDLWVWGPGIKEVPQLDPGCFFGGPCKLVAPADGRFTSGADESHKFKATKNATYYFQVAAFLLFQGNQTGSAGSYKLTVKKV